MKIKLKKGDEVIVLAGKNKGKTGKIVNVIPKKNKIIVSGVNIAKKHTKPNNEQAGGIVDKEMPIQISNVAYYDKETKKGVKIGYSFLKDGSKVRVNKKNNKEL
tara:strand:+ start:224 stop:535 length:312 start_codon:yes stop_codon:yes gene_type:complete